MITNFLGHLVFQVFKQQHNTNLSTNSYNLVDIHVGTEDTLVNNKLWPLLEVIHYGASNLLRHTLISSLELESRANGIREANTASKTLNLCTS